MSSKAARARASLARLRALRESGKKNDYEMQASEALYQEVDENEYKTIVRNRLDKDDFVVDDNGEGYADDGREEWDHVSVYETASEDEMMQRAQSKKPIKARVQEAKRHASSDRTIADYLTTAPAKAKMAQTKTEEEEDFMTGLLEHVDMMVSTPTARKRDRGASAAPETRQPRQKKARASEAAMDPSWPLLADQAHGSVTDHVPMSDPVCSSPAAKAARRTTTARAGPDGDAEEADVMEIVHAGAVAAPSVQVSASRPVRRIVEAEPCPSLAGASPVQAADSAVDASSWNSINQTLKMERGPPAESRGVGKIDARDAVEDDGSLHFFWTDYTEVHGSLCLFGKVRNKKTASHVSCFVKVDNILRTVFFLPRTRRVQDGKETEEVVEMMDLYREVDAIMTRMQVAMFKIKTCTRKYAFGLPGVPKEGPYLKLLYPYTKPALDATQTGETFSRLFGTTTALFEQFVLLKNIMGPCWLKIKDAGFDSIQNASHCRFEVLVEQPDMVAAASEADHLDAPPLTLMSVAMRTTYNAKDHKQELLAISARSYENVCLGDTTAADQLACRTLTLVRPKGAAFPLGFDSLARRRKKGDVRLMKHEADMLSVFLAQMDLVDPDVIVGHQLEGVDYSILLSRLREQKSPQWSRLGRLRRSQWPAGLGKTGGNVFAERQLMAGRLLCDLANEAGKSLMNRCQSWTLTEMCSIYLAENHLRQDVDNEAALQTWAATRDGLMDYLTHLETDTFFIAALALRVQMLPLTKVLTELAGNSWARTLTGTRAERNEFILLHEFHRHKYICPDKPILGGRHRAGDAAGDADAAGGKNKDSYKGGLVFEPEKGLFDKFVLVMDFNSLYPSIIQEFNICFTTVDPAWLGVVPSRDDDDVPDVPTGQEQGVLPRLIATLVTRRRQVKKLMQDSKATREQLATWDMKQFALKLTANSMYGCLGYARSRFYAPSLAVLTTYKGREILRSTKELAESKSLQVIYGDTDSVMINANVDNMADALRVGHDFKRAVNERYRLLEIDIDHVFRRILLQAKKKYAAISLAEKDGKYVEKMEVKGLDMRRREFCALSKEVSSRILHEILSGDDTDVAVQRVHEYLRETAASMRARAVAPHKYIIHTQLGKAPNQYPNGDAMPHVQVALRETAHGRTVRRGDVIAYIITVTLGDDGKPTNAGDAPASRAYMPRDVLRPGSGLVPDVEWYIGRQLAPPVERLCANLVGTSAAQLADHLGLDMGRHANKASSSHSRPVDQGLAIHPLESQMPDSVRFAGCARLSLRCRACKQRFVFEGLVEALAVGAVGPSGLACPRNECGAVLSTLSVVAQVEAAVRQAAARYYEAWLVCDDAACGFRTRQTSVYGTRCLGANGLANGDCLGRMQWELGERDIYTQIAYLASLWDVERARARAAPNADAPDKALPAEEREKVLLLAEHNRLRFGTVKGAVERYLDKCGRRWVAMDTLFAKLGFVPT